MIFARVWCSECLRVCDFSCFGCAIAMWMRWLSSLLLCDERHFAAFLFDYVMFLWFVVCL